MLAIFRTIEILLLFFALGLPLNFLLLDQIDRAGRFRRLSARLLLAPASGLIVFACYTVLFYAFETPVAFAIPFLPCVAAALWLLAIFRWRRQHRPAAANAAFLPGAGWSRVATVLLAVAGLAVTLGVSLWPFIQNPERVFWHYAGSDGYMYMRIAEHVGSPGTGVVPFVDRYDGAAGFTAAEMRQFAIRAFIDKPGTMSTLAGLAHFWGLTTHEIFSPLIVAAMAMLYLVLLAAGHLWLRLPAWAAVVLAVLGAAAPSAWMIQTHTFLGNALAFPLFVLVLMVVRPFPSWRTAAYLGLALSAEVMVFPDGFLALVGMLGVVTPYLLWCAWRRRRLTRLALSALITLSIGAAMTVPFRDGIFFTVFARFRQVSTAPAVFEGGISHLVAKSHQLIKPIVNTGWTWPALNLNYVPPRPLQPSEKPYLMALVLFLVLFLAGCLWRNRMRQLAWYLVGFACLFVGGSLGIFQSDYELFRALAVFSFIPLAAICSLPWVWFPPGYSSRAVLAGRVVTGLLLLPLLVHFARVDYYHFSFSYTEHSADAQYVRSDLHDRAALAKLAPAESLILAAETCSFTGFARVIMLFGNRPLGITTAFHKFVFFANEAERPGRNPYGSSHVLHNRDYVDIFTRIPELSAQYSSPNFAVTANDLVLFADNDTFPFLHGFPAKFVVARQLPVLRMLKEKTVLTFLSREARTLSLVLQFDPATAPAQLPYAFDSAPVQQASAQKKGLFQLADFPVSAGLHTLTLGPLETSAGVAAIRLYAEPIANDALPLQGHWRTYVNLTNDEQNRFRHMSPRPVRFFCQFDPLEDNGFLFSHPEARYVFQAPSGARHFNAIVRLPADSYENLPLGEATDGVQCEVALLLPGGKRAVMLSRHLDPAQVPADRGAVALESDFEVPPGAEIELSIGPGPAGRNNRDWCSLGNVSIQ